VVVSTKYAGKITILPAIVCVLLFSNVVYEITPLTLMFLKVAVPSPLIIQLSFLCLRIPVLLFSVPIVRVPRTSPPVARTLPSIHAFFA
jgi:hypothetical protein